MPEAIKETDCLYLMYSSRARVDAALWHFKVCSEWDAAAGWGSRCRSRHVCMDPGADPLHVTVRCGTEKSWRAGRALGHCWVLSSGGWPCSFRTSLGISADVSPSKINLSTCMFFAISNKLPGHLHYHIFPRVGCTKRIMQAYKCWRLSFFGLFVKTKHPPDFPPGPSKLPASGHIFLCELLAQ